MKVYNLSTRRKRAKYKLDAYEKHLIEEMKDMTLEQKVNYYKQCKEVDPDGIKTLTIASIISSLLKDKEDLKDDNAFVEERGGVQ